MQLNIPTLIQTSHISDICYSERLRSYKGTVLLTLLDSSGYTETVSVKTELKADRPLDGLSLSLKFTQAAAHLWRLCEITEREFNHTHAIAA